MNSISIIKSYCKHINIGQAITQPIKSVKPKRAKGVGDYDYITGRFRGLVTLLLLIAGAQVHAQGWRPNPKYIKRSTDTTNSVKRFKYQCWGTTAKGERCKLLVPTDHGYCWRHASQK